MRSSSQPATGRTLHIWWQHQRKQYRDPWSAIRRYHRPSNAPKPILDVKHIARNPGLYEQNCIDRNYKEHAHHAWRIHDLRKEQIRCQAEVILLRRRIKDVQRDIGKLEPTAQESSLESEASHNVNGKDVIPRRLALLSEAAAIRNQLNQHDSKDSEREKEIQDLALAMPNLSSSQSPVGTQPDVIESQPPSEYIARKSKTHVDIGTELALLDFAGAATSSGWGWYYLKDSAALLEQALVQLAISELHHRGWQIVSPPSIVYSHIASACGFQPRDQHEEQQIYQLYQNEKDKDKPSLSLAATAEIPLAGLYANKTIGHSELPIRIAAVSRCYRAEAGARGVDTKGLYRVHEFTKVEMFGWTMPDVEHDDSEHFATNPPQNTPSENMLNEMVAIQRSLLSKLGLSYRLLEMPTTDLGASATRKQDIEAYFPSRKARNEGYGEVTSASMCSDYQARRLGTRLRRKDAGLTWPYTINGTAMAIPRILAALLETHWDESSGTVIVPEALRPWMYGTNCIAKT